MARNATTEHGRNRLEETMALLIQNEAALLSRRAQTDRADVEFERRHLEFAGETAEWFARIGAKMAEIIRVLPEQSLILERLADAVRDTIGFKTQP